ncbi:zeta toxin family protein [Micromonospora sp. DT44]|uniref:zeta toxin family protein n=1 Tax=Micromonospora sp. DT44 TaxID=3393439 RepID=UPI003CE8FDB7
MGRTDAVVLDIDDLRPYHPDYSTHARNDDLTAAARVHPDAARWLDWCIAHVAEHGIDTVVSATFSKPSAAEWMVRQFPRPKFGVEVAGVAVDRNLSELGVLARYQDQRDRDGYGRYVPPDVRNRAYTGVLDAADHLEQHRLVGAVHVYDRDGQCLHTNRLVNGQWTAGRPSRQAIETERARPWTESEAKAFRTTAASLRTRLADELRPQLATITGGDRNLASLRIPAATPDAPEREFAEAPSSVSVNHPTPPSVPKIGTESMAQAAQVITEVERLMSVGVSA